MAARAAEPDAGEMDVVYRHLQFHARSIKSRRLSLGIQNSMGEVRSRVAICSTQSDYLLTMIQELSSRILNAIRDVNLATCRKIFVSGNIATFLSILDGFIWNMVAAEDLLYLCAQKSWKLAGLSVFLPASYVPCHSRFALLARDLGYTYYMFLGLLEAGATDQLYTSIGEALTDASNQDRAIVLHKLEGEPNKGSVHQEVYDSLLRKRFQGDASPSALGSIPEWCWIPRTVKYIILGSVAAGNFKSVLKCQWLGLDVAIAEFKGEYAKNDLEAEAGILASVQHPNVVSMFGCSYDDEKEEGYLVTELMEQDLRQLIRKSPRRRNPFSESVARDIILQIVEAMIHVHKCRVLHRDLKPANCLVSARKRIRDDLEEEAETYYVVKVIDFGASKVRGANASTCHTRKQGTTAYMAPELHAMPKDCAYKWPADVYSFGMTMYEIFTGKSPFEGEYTGEQLARRVCAGERPWGPINLFRAEISPIPFQWIALMEMCCHRDPKRRPSFAWIRLEIMRGLPHFNFRYYFRFEYLPQNTPRYFYMPRRILEEFLENSEGFTVETHSPEDGLSLWWRVMKYFIK